MSMEMEQDNSLSLQDLQPPQQQQPAPQGAQDEGAREGQDSPPDGSDPAAQPPEGGEKQPSVQDRINELTRNRRVAERVAAEAIEAANRKEQEIAQMRAFMQGMQRAGVQPGQPQGQQGDPDQAPRPEDFQDWDSYTRAVTRHEARAIMQRNEEVQRQQQQHRQMQEAQQLAQHAHNVREATLQTAVETGVEKFGQEFVKAVSNPALPSLRALHPSVLDAVAYSEVVPDLMYYFGKNPADAHRIAGLHPTLAIREIGRLEQRISSGTVQLSSAAPPVDRVRGGSNAPDPLSDRASIETWMKARNRQVQGRR